MPTSVQLDQDTYTTLANNAAAHYGVPVSTLVAIQQVENPNLNVNATSSTNVTGLAQITQATWNSFNPGVPYSNDPAAQINVQAKILAFYTNRYGGDLSLVAAAYNGGQGTADLAVRIKAADPSLTDAQAIAKAAAQVTDNGVPFSANKQAEINNYVAKVTGQQAASTQSVSAATNTSTNGSVFDNRSSINPVAFIPVPGQTIPASQLNAYVNLAYPTKVISAGLSETPWWANDNILQPPSPAFAYSRFPVSFEIYVDSLTPLGIDLNLVASVNSFKKSMRHVINKTYTRTGLMIDTWGMAPDRIEGQASTGVMMNIYGLNSFISMGQSNEANLITALGGLSAYENLDTTPADGALRIAARDAFVEFLAMFKNNGSVWFQNQNYTGFSSSNDQTTGNLVQGDNPLNGDEQLAPDVWSPVTGSTTYQNAARRNDVMSRGFVLMNFRNSQYQGYFDSMNWTMDADNPFRWNFTFSFVVEKTVTTASLPLNR